MDGLGGWLCITDDADEYIFLSIIIIFKYYLKIKIYLIIFIHIFYVVYIYNICTLRVDWFFHIYNSRISHSYSHCFKQITTKTQSNLEFEKKVQVPRTCLCIEVGYMAGGGVGYGVIDRHTEFLEICKILFDRWYECWSFPCSYFCTSTQTFQSHIYHIYTSTKYNVPS